MQKETFSRCSGHGAHDLLAPREDASGSIIRWTTQLSLSLAVCTFLRDMKALFAERLFARLLSVTPVLPSHPSSCPLLLTFVLALSSVVDPMRRLWMNPLARPIIVSRKNYTRGIGLTRRFSG